MAWRDTNSQPQGEAMNKLSLLTAACALRYLVATKSREIRVKS